MDLFGQHSINLLYRYLYVTNSRFVLVMVIIRIIEGLKFLKYRVLVMHIFEVVNSFKTVSPVISYLLAILLVKIRSM